MPRPSVAALYEPTETGWRIWITEDPAAPRAAPASRIGVVAPLPPDRHAMTTRQTDRPANVPVVFVVSGGAGVSGAQLVRTAVAQFRGARVALTVVPHVRSSEQLDAALDQAAAAGAAVIHTLVDANLRQALARRARARSIPAIDLMGPVLASLAGLLQQEPVGRPGLYRQLHQEYFQRVEAMEFTVAHDDGRNLEQLAAADIVLFGVSRVGKTPLSMYLALQGWKVANVPFVSGIDPPAELLAVQPRRIVGLTIAADQLLVHRRARAQRLGVTESTAYTALDELQREHDEFVRFCREHRLALIDVTDRPIEESAYEVLRVASPRQAGRGGSAPGPPSAAAPSA